MINIIQEFNFLENTKFGLIKEITGDKITCSSLQVSIGDFVNIKKKGKNILANVVSVKENEFILIPFKHVDGLSVNDKVFKTNKNLNIKISDSFKGRIINGLGESIDNKGTIIHEKPTERSILSEPISALSREPITEFFSTGVKAIDGILSCGKGQKLGIFAGSGVGKSTLLSMITKNSDSDIKIIALIGERGREVLEFLEQNLNNELDNIIMIVATSDESPLMRKFAAFTAMSIAEHYRDQGQDVLFILDSITRVAIAQREIGLLSGELPALKGYTPSVFTLLPQLLERISNVNNGTMTGFFTVLVDGDNLNDPIADQTRSILDGHIVLDRKLTESGVYPPINILKSASRVTDLILTPEDIKIQNRFRELLSIITENETLVNIGAYQKGNNQKLDFALRKKEMIYDFIKQGKLEKNSYNRIKEELIKVVS